VDRRRDGGNDLIMALTFLQATTNTEDLTTYTFSSQNLGDADAGRYILVAISARKAGSDPATINSVTIGGVSATIISQIDGTDQNSNVVGYAIAKVPTGTTGNIVVTFAAGMVRCVISAYRITDLSSTTPYDSATSTATDPTGSIDVPAGGFAVANAISNFQGSVSFSGLTEDASGTLESYVTYGFASDTFVSAQSGLSITANFSGSSSRPLGMFLSFAVSSGNERSAKITGKASTDSSRSSKIYGAYVSPQYLYWTKINSDTKTLEKVVVYEKEVTKPSDSSVTWHASPDGGSNWESITAGTVHTFVNSGNDLRLRATLSASSDYKSTPSLDRVSVVWTELDSVSVNNERGAFISGQTSTSDEREATITGRDTANDERSAKTVGSDSSNDERPIFLTGQDTGSDERPANITGQSTTTAESLAKTFGQDSDSDERQSKISGKNTANNEIGVKISGKATTNLEREAKIAGKNADSGEIQSKIVGKDTSEASRSAKVFGQDSTSDERNVKIAGQTATLDQRFSKTIGKDTIISIRPLKISGQDFSEDYRDVKITGKKSADSDRLAKIHGKGVDTSIRTLKITGKNSSTSESAARIVGSIDTSSQRQTTVKGQSTASSDVLVKITGQDSSFIAKLATIYGKDITNSQRSAKLVGVVGSGLSQRSARIKGSSKWYKPDPKTMSSDSPTTFQTSNPTDWYEPDPKTPMTQNDDGFSKPY